MSTSVGPPKGGDHEKAPMLRCVLGSHVAVATIVVALRLFTRLRLTRSPGWDDWIMLATFVRCSRWNGLAKFIAPWLPTGYQVAAIVVELSSSIPGHSENYPTAQELVVFDC